MGVIRGSPEAVSNEPFARPLTTMVRNLKIWNGLPNWPTRGLPEKHWPRASEANRESHDAEHRR